jgi:hypothetical protein
MSLSLGVRLRQNTGRVKICAFLVLCVLVEAVYMNVAHSPYFTLFELVFVHTGIIA